MSAYSHAELPFEQMVELAVHDRHAGLHPLHQMMFVLLEEGVPALQFDQSTGRPVFVETDTSKCDLTLSVLRTEGEWICQWEYDSDLFLPETITRMSGHWSQMLSSVIENPEQSIGHLELMSAAERHQVLVEWNNTAREYPRDKCVHELFEEQVTRTPDAVAVVFEDQSLTYAELNARANQLAHHLQSLGVGPEVLVGLFFERSLEMVIAIWATVKVGGAYVPIDPGYPSERIAAILIAGTVIRTRARTNSFLTHAADDATVATTGNLPPRFCASKISCPRTCQLPTPTPATYDSTA